MKTETSYVTTKGQVVIPARLRRALHIDPGTRVLFQKEGGRLFLQPVTKEYVRSLRGLIKLKPGEKPATQELLEDRAEDLKREEAKFENHGL